MRAFSVHAEAEPRAVAEKAETWRDGSRSLRDWNASMAAHVLPQLGRMHVDAVATADVKRVLRPLALAGKHATARMVAGRIAAVLEWAEVENLREPAGSGRAAVETVMRSLPKASPPAPPWGRWRQPQVGIFTSALLGSFTPVLTGREFVGDEDLNAQASRWLEGTANVRVHGTTGERPVDRFERDERAVLLPLAGRPYRRLGAATPAAAAPARPQVAVDVEKRSLRVYAEAAG